MNNQDISKLESDALGARLAGLRQLLEERPDGSPLPPFTDEVNNHVHTHYSFSPYSPSSAVYHARVSGLRAIGSVDHDSIGAAEELLDAAAIMGIGSTVGAELRVNFFGTPFGNYRLNNPDSIGIAYIVLHGVPRNRIEELKEYLAPLQAVRNERNRAQVERLNRILAAQSLDQLDFDRDVLPLSWADRDGTVTERHMLFALAGMLEDRFGRGEPLLEALRTKFDLVPSASQRVLLSDPGNPHFRYDLLGVFKGQFVQRFFIQPDERECRPVEEVVSLGNRIGAIPAYAYLGDVGESPTGDKAAQAFEDAFLDELMALLPQLGFRAVTYMPPRNTREQLARIRRLCAHHGLMEISGVDINSSRQVFTCPEVMQPEFRHLVTNTWGLIAHEKLVVHDERLGLFHERNPWAAVPLTERIARYAAIAYESDLHRPEDLINRAIAAFPDHR